MRSKSSLRQPAWKVSEALVSTLYTLQPGLIATARQITGSRADAEDIVQEAFVRALTQLQDQPAMSHEHLRRWLFTVVRRAAIDNTRRARTRPVVTAQLDSLVTESQEPPARWRTVDIGALSDLLRGPSWPPSLRNTFRLRFEHGLSYVQISRELGVPTQTVGTRLNRAVRKLRRELLERVVMNTDGTPAIILPEEPDASE